MTSKLGFILLRFVSSLSFTWMERQHSSLWKEEPLHLQRYMEWFHCQGCIYFLSSFSFISEFFSWSTFAVTFKIYRFLLIFSFKYYFYFLHKILLTFPLNSVFSVPPWTFAFGSSLSVRNHSATYPLSSPPPHIHHSIHTPFAFPPHPTFSLSSLSGCTDQYSYSICLSTLYQACDVSFCALHFSLLYWLFFFCLFNWFGGSRF